MAAADTRTREDVVAMIDVFVTQLAEAVTARLVLDDAPIVVGITITAVRRKCDSSSGTIEYSNALVGIIIGHTYNKAPVDIGGSDGGSAYLVQHVVHYVIGVNLKASACTCAVDGVELRLPPDVDIRADTAFVAHGYIGIDVEILPVCLVGFDGKEILHAFAHVQEEVPLGNVLGIIAVAQEHDVDASGRSLRCLLECHLCVLVVFVVELLHGVVTGDGVPLFVRFACQGEHDAVPPVGRAVGQGIYRDGELSFLEA